MFILLTVPIIDGEVVILAEWVVAAYTVRCTITCNFNNLVLVRDLDVPFACYILWVGVWPVWCLEYAIVLGSKVSLAQCCTNTFEIQTSRTIMTIKLMDDN